MRYLQSATFIMCMFASCLSTAEGSLTVFKAGDKVKAAEINANFELVRAAAADAVTFEGLDEVYGGVTTEDAQASSLNRGFYHNGTPDDVGKFKDVFSRQSQVNALGDSIVACSEDDTSCVIKENRVSVKCDGTAGKLSSVLTSPYANAAFLKIEIEGDCVEGMLVTRGAAFFSKAGTRASITSIGDQVAVFVGHYSHFENIDINGRLTAGRGSILVLEKDVKIVKDAQREGNFTGNLGVYASEGAFVKFGSNVTVEGSVIIGNATVNMYGDGIAISGNLTVNGGSLEATNIDNGLAGVIAPSINVVNGAVVNLKNGSFDFNNIFLSSNATMNISSTGQTAISSLKTGNIFAARSSVLNLLLLKEINATDANIVLWGNSMAYMSIEKDQAIKSIELDSSSTLRLGPTDGAQFSVDDLSLGFGASITSNNGETASNIVVTESLTADYNSRIQYGTVELASGATANIEKGCASKGLNDDLCTGD